jgi:hypothetical protein
MTMQLLRHTDQFKFRTSLRADSAVGPAQRRRFIGSI